MNTRDPLYTRFIKNDLAKNKVTNIVLLIIVTLSAFLIATGSIVIERLSGSVNSLFAEAKPPHFLQMYKGAYDTEDLRKFASSRTEISEWLIEDMLEFDGTKLSWQRTSTGEAGDLSSSLIDNLFVTQNKEFDFLIAENNTIPNPSRGNIYLPISYGKQFGLHTDDIIKVATPKGVLDLRIQGFVRDSQMASSLSAAIRFLISEEDFHFLKETGAGSPEIIVEYRLKDPSSASRFQQIYESDDSLPKNGQAVTYQMIRLVNTFSDGLSAIALILAGLLLILVSFLILRFIIRGSLEENIQEIGAMKALGIPSKEISRLYLLKYRVLTILSCLIGGSLALLAARTLTRELQTNYSRASFSLVTILVPAISLLCAYTMITSMCKNILRKVKKIDVVSALVHRSILDEKSRTRLAKKETRHAQKSRLTATKFRNLNVRLSILDLLSERKSWALIPIVFFIMTVLMTLPMNILTTFESPRFITYMGSPNSDIRVDLQLAERGDETYRNLLSALKNDKRLSEIKPYSNVVYEAKNQDLWESIRIEIGHYSGGEVELLDGNLPGHEEIALSILNAEKYGLKVGDTLTIRKGNKTTPIKVSGIYQDITSGGFTAKMNGDITAGANSYVVFANITKGIAPSEITKEYNARFPGIKMIPTKDYTKQTLKYVTDAFRVVSILSFLVGISMAGLILSLFLKLRLIKDRRKTGVLTVLGFSSREICNQFFIKTLLSVSLGVLLGLGITVTAGESLLGLSLSAAGLGITRLTFLTNPLLTYLVYPLTLIAIAYVSVLAITTRWRRAESHVAVRLGE